MTGMGFAPGTVTLRSTMRATGPERGARADPGEFFRADAAAERLPLQAGTFTGIHVVRLLAPFVLDDMYRCRVC